jgi:hypothetical protein
MKQFKHFKNKKHNNNFEKLVFDAPIYKEVKESLFEGIAVGMNASHHNYGTYQDLYEIEYSDRMLSTLGSFCTIFSIITILAFATFLITAIIDSIVNSELYEKSEKDSLIRGGELLIIIMICWYTIMIPIVIVVMYNKKYNIVCYQRTCNFDIIFSPCKFFLDYISCD